MERVIYSTVVNQSAMHAYAGYYLALSLMKRAQVDSDCIVVQFLPEVPNRVVATFQKLGVRTARTPDGSKLSQVGQFTFNESDYVVFLEPNTIIIESLDDYFGDNIIVSIANGRTPSQNTVKTILSDLGMTLSSQVHRPEKAFGDSQCGFVGIPGEILKRLIPIWKENAVKLSDQKKVGVEKVDLAAFFLALHAGGIKPQISPSNANYVLDDARTRTGFDHTSPIRAIRYSGACINVVGTLECRSDPLVSESVAMANNLIRQYYDNYLFWNFRYENFPDRGSGVGSRGEVAAYKRELFCREGITTAQSVLDFGCGDLEVLKPLKLVGYVGLDQSESALETAREARPDWEFRQFTQSDSPDSLPECEVVICMEVLIHQIKEEDYRRIIDIITSKCGSTLFVSGYETPSQAISVNHMLAFYEPLSESLRKTGRFSTIKVVGCHSEFVTILRCDRFSLGKR